MKEMEKISKEERVWRASTNNEILLEDNVDVIAGKDLNKCINDIYGTTYHDFRANNDDEDNYLNLYFNENNGHDIYKIKNGGIGPKYIVLIEKCYNILHYPERSFVMDGIISVPKTLYLFEVFLNKRFDLLKDIEIDELLKLFVIQHIGRIYTSALKNICEYELLTDSYESIINRTNINKNVVSKVKKLAK